MRHMFCNQLYVQDTKTPFLLEPISGAPLLSGSSPDGKGSLLVSAVFLLRQ